MTPPAPAILTAGLVGYGALVQMGWGRAQWYTQRGVDTLLFPDNGPSADRLVPAWQDVAALAQP